MDINKTAPDDVGRPLKLLPDEIYHYLIIVWPSMWLVICPFGIWGNGLIIRTFLRMGLNDSISISFFSLALSDFCHVVCPLGSIGVYVMAFMEAKFQSFFKVQSLLMMVYLGVFTGLFNTLTMFITAFLALQRCLCIVKALHFKEMFTKKQTWCIMGVFTGLSIIPTAAYMSSHGGAEWTNPHTNKSQYVITTNPWLKNVDVYVGTPFNVMFPVVSQCLVFGCVIVMSYGLKASIKFRKETSLVTVSQKQRPLQKNKPTDQENEGAQKQNSKERTAIIQVIFLSVIFLTTNLPKIIYGLGLVFIPGLGFGQEYNNLRRAIIGLRVTSDFLNSAVNILIYYKYNSRFRQMCFAPQNKRNKETN